MTTTEQKIEDFICQKCGCLFEARDFDAVEIECPLCGSEDVQYKNVGNGNKPY
jgi:rubrerythrin